jgi:hypothetical protein
MAVSLSPRPLLNSQATEATGAAQGAATGAAQGAGRPGAAQGDGQRTELGGLGRRRSGDREL